MSDDDVKKNGSMTQRICSNVLESARSIDSSAFISTFANVAGGESTLVRVRMGSCKATRAAKTSLLVENLKKRWPLASICLTENALDGTTEAHFLLPSREECVSLAYEHAQQTDQALQLKKIVKIMAGVTFIAFIFSLV